MAGGLGLPGQRWHHHHAAHQLQCTAVGPWGSHQGGNGGVFLAQSRHLPCVLPSLAASCHQVPCCARRHGRRRLCGIVHRPDGAAPQGPAAVVHPGQGGARELGWEGVAAAASRPGQPVGLLVACSSTCFTTTLTTPPLLFADLAPAGRHPGGLLPARCGVGAAAAQLADWRAGAESWGLGLGLA